MSHDCAEHTVTGKGTSFCARCEAEARLNTEALADSRKRANRALLESLLALWDVVPDQRFGQLVMNLSREPDGFADTWEWKHGSWYKRIAEAYEKWAA